MSDKIQASDKIDLHYRQQLSALIDGALAPDEARFLLRRIQHDGELAECWERWQLAGEVLRGRATAVLPAGFAVRVGAAIAADSATALQTSVQPRTRWARWGGSAALAASVAVVAMLVMRQAPDVDSQRQQASPIVAAAPTSAVESQAPLSSVPARVGAEQRVASAAASTAVAGAPGGAAQRTRPMQRPRDVTRRPAAAIDATRVEIAAAPAMSTPQSPPSFVTGTLPAARPWPRAVLPQFGANGALTADTAASASPSFYPFEPRLPESVAEPEPAVPTPR